MQREITLENLQKHLAEVMRKVATGDTFIVTSKGVRVAEVRPFQPAAFAPTETVMAAYNTPRIDASRLPDVDKLD